ncbi:LysR substrate-binding domain-containing protein [Ensifer adhaerens]|uniref:LysR substrate-binding domain-containing protein n=1 Tax=Ensifer adhaerens TaxID=106592 RepID=UPI00384A674C
MKLEQSSATLFSATLAKLARTPEDHMDLSDMDLNLLTGLSSILRCQRMSEVRDGGLLSARAAARSLQRLRRHFKDELIVMGKRDFTLTPFAETLRPKVTIALEAIDNILSAGAPPPEKFTMAMPDHQALVLTGHLTALLRETSPGTAFRPVVGFNDALAKLASGELDLVLGNTAEAPSGFFRRSVPASRIVCLCRRDHIGRTSALRIEDLARFASIRVVVSNHNALGDVDDGLQQLRPLGASVVTVPDIHTAAVLLRETDAILPLPIAAARRLAELYHLDFLELPENRLPDYKVSLIWHERSHRDGIHVAVRNNLVSCGMRGANGSVQRAPDSR